MGGRGSDGVPLLHARMLLHLFLWTREFNAPAVLRNRGRSTIELLGELAGSAVRNAPCNARTFIVKRVIAAALLLRSPGNALLFCIYDDVRGTPSRTSIYIFIVFLGATKGVGGLRAWLRRRNTLETRVLPVRGAFAFAQVRHA